MAYSTGSGTYTDLMAAVLAHAIADGWTTTGGDWPISKGGVRGVDWTVETGTDQDYTNGGSKLINTTVLVLAVGTSPADATAQLGIYDSVSKMANMQYAIDQWHIFSDTTDGNYIHVHVQFATADYPVCFTGFSFGEVDSEGMTHDPIAYTSTIPARAYATSNDQGTSSDDFNGGTAANNFRHFCGQSYGSWNPGNGAGAALRLLTPAANNPFPALPGWPLADEYVDPSFILDTLRPDEASGMHPEDNPFTATQETPGIAALSGYAAASLYSGGVSMSALPCIITDTNTSSTTTKIMYLGSFPGVRFCSLKSYLPNDTVTYGAQDWALFPMLRKTDHVELGQKGVVSSGEFGYAYRKVV